MAEKREYSMRSKHFFLAAALMTTSVFFPGCGEPPSGPRPVAMMQQQPVTSYADDENTRLKQLLVQYENDARNAHVVVADANTRAERSRLELDAANKKLAIYDSEVPQLRTLAANAASAVQQAAINNAYASYATTGTTSTTTSTRRSMSDKTTQQLSTLAEQFGGVVVGNRLELPGDFFFDSGKYELNPNARSAIRRMAEILGGENLYLMVVGHTDSDPIKNPALRSKGITDNLHLSLLRAKAVVDELRKAGYPSSMMYPTGWGDQRPLVPNTDKASKKLNRRVDILIDPDASNLFGMSTITGIEPVGPNQSSYSTTTYTEPVTTSTYSATTTSYPGTTTMYVAEPTGASSYSTTSSYSTQTYPAAEYTESYTESY